jgi:hypothetical protein
MQLDDLDIGVAIRGARRAGGPRAARAGEKSGGLKRSGAAAYTYPLSAVVELQQVPIDPDQKGH